MYVLGRTFLTLLFGFAIGVVLTLITLINNSSYSERPVHKLAAIGDFSNHGAVYKEWFANKGLERIPAAADELSFGPVPAGKSTESRFLFDRVSVICAVFVKKLSNAYAVSETWGRRCNRVHYFGKISDKYLDITTIGLKSSWQFLCDSIRHLWSDSSSKIQWVLFAHDDLYVIPDNLRYLVAPLDFNLPYYLGHNAMFWNQIYNSGAAGYVLSRGSILALLQKFNTADSCANSGKYFNNEDFYLGKYLSEMGIKTTDCRDEKLRERFHIFTPAQLMAPGSGGVLAKYSQRSLHPVTQGADCCSPTSVTFQGTENDLLFFYTYLLYNVKIFTSGHLANNKSRVYTHSDQVWQRFIIEEHINVDMKNVTADLYYQLWTLRESSPEEFNKRIRAEALGLNSTFKKV